jgi:hypothetical protein
MTPRDHNFAEPWTTENPFNMAADADIDVFLSDPSAHFGYSLTNMMGLSRARLESLPVADLMTARKNSTARRRRRRIARRSTS